MAEDAPLLRMSASTSRASERSRGCSGRLNVINLVGLAAAALGSLVLYGSDLLRDIGSTDATAVSSDEGEALALSPDFIDRLNARPNRSWTARVPQGMERARHSDLKRMAGGRLSDAPRSDAWTTSEFASVETLPAEGDDAGVYEMSRDIADETVSVHPSLALGTPVSRQTKRPASALGKAARTFGLSGRLGGFIENFIGGPKRRGEFRPSDHGLPEHFDARERWPQCATLIGGGRDQGNCGSCWAMAPAEVMSDRLCIQTGGAVKTELSPYQLLSCATYGSMGCEGGESSTAYEYAKDVGIVSGSKFGDTETCAPYPFEACHHPCSVFPTPTCPKTCVNKDAGPFANMEDKVMVEKITACPSFDYACVARELFNNGPVSSYAGDIYEEFYAYSDGVFRESKDENSRGVNHGGHVIKVIGWGKEPNESEKKGEYYWIIVNSWLNWGQEGVGKVAMGEVGIGVGVEAAVMQTPTATRGGRRPGARSRQSHSFSTALSAGG